jgi:dTDP-4-dehydrorhamnose reductase
MTALRERGHALLGTYRQHPQAGLVWLDTADPAGVASWLERLRPDWLFYPAGLSWVDLCEHETERCHLENVALPVAVAHQAARQGAGFVYYSTEYVFDGDHGPYTEQAAPHPLSEYGRSKLAAEKSLMAVTDRLIIVRTTVVYGPELQRKNFVYQLVAKLRRGEIMVVPNDQISTPTYNLDLACASVECAEQELTGIINLVGPDRLSRYEFALAACRVLDLDEQLVTPRATGELGQLAPRPLNAGLLNDYSRRCLNTRLRGVLDGLTAARAAGIA